MQYFSITKIVRINKKIDDKLIEVLKLYPDDYRNEADLIRSAINYFLRYKLHKTTKTRPKNDIIS